VIKVGRQLVIVECRVTDPAERIVASADFSMMIVPQRQALRPMEGAQPHDPDL
jgi:acyl-coenzyme A thioesterase PaaI-like protein